MNRINFHTHTERCGHACGMPGEFCAEALNQQFTVLGFADHAPFPDNRYSKSRMPFVELPEYLADVRKAKKNFPGLAVYTGLEIEYCGDLGASWYRAYMEDHALDYIIGSAHSVELPDHSFFHFAVEKWASSAGLRAFVRQTIRTMELLPILYLAHPDGFASLVEYVTPELRNGFRDIAEAAKDLHVPVELNAAGFRKGLFRTGDGERYRYPLNAFWEIAGEYGLDTVIGSDAHRPEDLSVEYDRCVEYARKYGLSPVNERLAAELEKRTAKGGRE